MTFLSWWKLLACSRMIMVVVSDTWTSSVVTSPCCRLRLSVKAFLFDTLTFHGLILLSFCAGSSPEEVPGLIWPLVLYEYPPPGLLLQQTELWLPRSSPLCIWTRDKEKVRGEKTPSGKDYSSDDRRGYQMWCRFLCVCAEKKLMFFL